jgi:hypothetical protein
MIDQNILKHFGVDERVFLEALKQSPSAQGYIMGAISEVLLKEYLEAKGFEVIRIKEKPSGGNNAKNYEARGDFYVRKNGSKEDKWFVIESKGLKSNSEFRGGKLDSPEKVFKFLRGRIFNSTKTKKTIFDKGFATYLKTKKLWEKKNPGKHFPDFRWNKKFPGAECYNLSGIWKNEEELKKWVFSLDKKYFTEDAYRNVEGAIAILETHQPSKRVGIKTGIDQAAPLVYDFNIMSVDLFLRTGKHDFVFMNSEEISHSPTSPEHLYQNYTIDFLIKGKKEKPIIQAPWYDDVDNCITKTKPQYRKIDKTQLDNR